MKKILGMFALVAGLALLPGCCCQEECSAPAKKAEKKPEAKKVETKKVDTKKAPSKKKTPAKKKATAPKKKEDTKKKDVKKTSFAHELTVEYGEDLAPEHRA